MKTVTFFGHRDTPKEMAYTLRMTLINLITSENALVFYVGNNGAFDSIVSRQLQELSAFYPIKYNVVLAYMPDKKNISEDMSATLYPEGIENVPKRFAISWRNKWMLKQSDIVVTYVTHPVGGAFKFKTLAEKQGKTIIELSNSAT